MTNKLQETAEIFNLTDQHADTVCDRLKPLLQKLNIKLRVSSKPNKLPNDKAKTTKPSKAISKSALLKDDKEVEVSVDLGGMYIANDKLTYKRAKLFIIFQFHCREM